MKLWHLILGVFLVVFSILLMSFLHSQESPETDIRYLSSDILSSSFAYNQNQFLKTVSLASDNVTEKSKIVILPHHLLASPLIYKGLSTLDIKQPKSTVIILSPNHSDISNCPISYSNLPWDTPYGEININKKIQRKLISQKEICEDNSAFKSEHGVASLLPFLKFLYPELEVVPLIFKKSVSLESLDYLSASIAEALKDENIFLVSSLDFSHNLSSTDSVIKDMETKRYVDSKDYSKIITLGAEHLDSPPVLITTLQAAHKSSFIENMLEHKNSSFYNQNSSLVTSYFLYTYSKKNNNNLTLLFGGDVMLARSVNTQMIKRNDYAWPVEKIKSLTSSADLFMVNLESPFGQNCQPTDKGMIFCADPQSIKSLTNSGVDVISIANNHIGNQGEEGIALTKEILTQNSILHVGESTSTAQVINIKGVKVGILGFNDIPPYTKNINKLTEETLINQIKLLRPQVDILVLTAHWGNEYSMRSLRQQQFAHLAIDNGVDAVIGHHPHWVQEYEEYKGKPIYYSLGNLIFDQMWSEETKKGLMVRLTYQGKNLIKQEKLPVKIIDFGQPTLVQ